MGKTLRSGRTLSESCVTNTTPPTPHASSTSRAPALPCVCICAKCHNDKLLFQQIAEIRTKIQRLLQSPPSEASFCSASSLPDDTVEWPAEALDANEAVQDLERTVNELLEKHNDMVELETPTETSPVPPNVTPDSDPNTNSEFQLAKATPNENPWHDRSVPYKKPKPSKTAKVPKKPTNSPKPVEVARLAERPAAGAINEPPVEKNTEKTLFVYGIAQVGAAIEESVEELAMSLQTVFNKVLPPNQTVTISRVVRIRPTNSDDVNPGPLKVTLASKKERDCLLQSRKMMSSSSRSQTPFFCREYSLAERIKHRLLRAEMKQRKEAGESNLVIRNGKVVKKALKGFLVTPLTITGCVERQ